MRFSYQFVLLFFLGTILHAQEVDMIIKGGHVIDPKNGIDAIMDVSIDDGKILAVGENLGTEAFRVIDAAGMYVVPGLIDIHGHHFFGTEEDHYLSNSYTALPPDGFTLRAGVTTVVDCGGAGWRNFNTFKNQAIDHSKTRVLAFLNIVGSGMAGGAIEQNLADMDAKLTAMEAKANAKYIVGIKVAHYMGPEWKPVEQAVEAGNMAGIPVIVDFGGNEPPLSIKTLFFDKLRPGDIFTHCYAHVDRREPVVNPKTRKVEPFVFDAQKRGIIMDVGHGGGSFLWDQAIPAVEQGLKPNTISTDLHTGSMNGGMKDMTNVMSKCLYLGLTMPEVIAASTWKPAQVINRPELGHLSPGAEADVAILKVMDGEFGLVDTKGWRVDATQKIVCEMTLRAGTVVWDLNGISRPEWEK
ncbi:MAG: amidohydrolase/deacetylase family metallohydrolase [Saprospiraceae bacterium]|nr:amidohydrolase/deacetylase family metallohydrolase [Saprospiraceae bacterium]